MTPYENFKKKARDEYIDYDNFLKVRNEVFSNLDARRKKNAYEDGGIGALSEKSIHAFLKRYIEPDTDYHEVALEGFFADICRDGRITEIQTRGLGRLRKKLDVFLNYYPVTVVYPMPVNKWIGRIEKGCSEPDGFRLSPVHMNEYSAFDEIYGIKTFLKNPNLRLHLYFMDMEEVKIHVPHGGGRGRKKSRSGYERMDRFPLGIRQIMEFNCPNDYLCLIPADLDDTFTSAQMAESAGIGRNYASLVLNVLNETGVVSRVGKKGNAYLYEVAY